MYHAEAHERIVDLAIEPGGLDRLDLDRPEAGRDEDRAFVEHIRGCQTCTADLAATRAIQARLDMALREVPDDTAVEPIAPPAWLRDAVLAAARGEPRLGAARAHRTLAAGGPDGGARWSLTRWTSRRWATTLAAALVLALLGGVAGATFARLNGPDPSITSVVATLDRVLTASDHRLVALRTPAGAPSGSVAWTSSDFAVLTSSLPAATSGKVYRCWLEWSGRWAMMGAMEFAGGTAYWTGSSTEWSRALAEPDARLVVTLEPAGPAGDEPSGSTILEAALGA